MLLTRVLDGDKHSRTVLLQMLTTKGVWLVNYRHYLGLLIAFAVGWATGSNLFREDLVFSFITTAIIVGIFYVTLRNRERERQPE